MVHYSKLATSNTQDRLEWSLYPLPDAIYTIQFLPDTLRRWWSAKGREYYCVTTEPLTLR